MKSSTLKVTPENAKESVELLQVSCELGGFPILTVKTAEGDLGESRDSLISLNRL